MIEKMEEMLGRALTERERNNVNWLLGWDKETIETFNELFAAFFKAGQEDANFSRAARISSFEGTSMSTQIKEDSNG